MGIEKLFHSFPILESSGILLKKVEDSDLKDLFDIYDDDRVFEFCGIFPKHNIETVSHMIGHFERDYNKRSRIKWGIYLKEESNRLVGIIEAMDPDQKINKVTVGYFLNRQYWGRGIATEALRILVDFLFNVIEVNRIQADVMPDNNNSKRVLLKNGFIKEGLIRQATFWSGKGIVDLEMYSILRTDYSGIKAFDMGF